MYVTDKVAWSEDATGGWLIHSLFQVLRQKLQSRERFSLISTLTEVCCHMAMESESNTSDPTYHQMKCVPSVEFKLTQDIYFPLHFVD